MISSGESSETISPVLSVGLLEHLGDVGAVGNLAQQVLLLLRHIAVRHAVNADGKAVHDRHIGELLHDAAVLHGVRALARVHLQVHRHEGAFRLIVIARHAVVEQFLPGAIRAAHRVDEALELLVGEKGEIKHGLRGGGFLLRDVDRQQAVFRFRQKIAAVVLHLGELRLRVGDAGAGQIRIGGKGAQAVARESVHAGRQLHREVHLRDLERFSVFQKAGKRRGGAAHRQQQRAKRGKDSFFHLGSSHIP